jgi:hypothetical protein
MVDPTVEEISTRRRASDVVVASSMVAGVAFMVIPVG